jgi:ABC-type glycerol-3-phosphate transport system permease component
LPEPASRILRARFPRPGTVLLYAALLLALIQAIGPVIWIVTGSLKTQRQFYTDPWSLPSTWRFHNYVDAFVTARVGDYLGNSLIVVALGVLLLIVSAATTAYALARIRFRGRSAVLLLILATMMVPPDILTIPLFAILRSLGLLGTFFGLACVYAAGGYGMSVLLLRSYFLAVPLELEDAARLEGAGTLAILRHVVLPMALPGFLTVAIIQAMGMWNDLYLAFVFLRAADKATVPIGLLNFLQRSAIDWPTLLAALTTLTVPVLILFTLFQRRFVEGYLAGAVK